VNGNSLNDRAASYRDRAQAYRTEAVEIIVSDLGPLDATMALSGSKIKSLSSPRFLPLFTNELGISNEDNKLANSLLNNANNLDSAANNIEAGASYGQFLTQFSLGIGSALFGAVLGWLITQFLAELRWRKGIKPSLAKLPKSG
jgi:hypothetical protein